MTTRHRSVCVIGAGPRGLSVLERLCANFRSQPQDSTVHIHVVDPYPPGPGKVWRTDQSPHLLMNTVAGQISVFTDASVDLRGPLEPGPSLHEWAVALAAGEVGGHHPAQALAEARSLGPDTYPTRAFYGRYLRWAYQHVTGGAPAAVTVSLHPHLAVALDDDPGAEDPTLQRVTLSDGTVLEGLDAVILCQGHLPARADAAAHDFAARARRAGLLHIAPANPADVDLDVLPPGTAVLLRGLGLNFFDYLAQLTAGRGGTFARVSGRLVYHPCGREPRIHAASRRGIPYQARGENEKGPHGRHEPLLLTAERIARLRRTHDSTGLDFKDQLWPLIAREVETVYYRTLLTSRGYTLQAQRFQDDYLAAGPHQRHTDAVIAAYGIGEKDRWDWELIARPYRDREFTGPDDFTGWLLDHLREDVAEAHCGNVSGPRKAALDVLRDLRNEIRLAVDHGGLHGDSYRTHLDHWYTPLNAYLSIGPPARRVEEMIALIEAGVLHVVGPQVQVAIDTGSGTGSGAGSGRAGYIVSSPLVPGSALRVDALVEARLPDITLSRTGDPLLRHLLATGQCTAYRIRTRRTDAYQSDGLAVTTRPFRLIDAAGRPHPRRFAFGVPTESVHWVTAAGIRPGVNSVTLTDSDAIARAALACTADTTPGTGPEHHAAPGTTPPGGQAPTPHQGLTPAR
ncbi:putative NAD(P)/FAD-binding protein YdhS [Streptomyces sp. 3330]|uniref:FAD/NAD(P)-binding protein n=1 Tax=Streptomyces sp. 3330 TaxID=2817755 RepID=UPI00285C08E0|nr:FAD/NAD(P)-binding protein [Streptomyces sp. 3330]MDR6980680.1 putative NAD(P)/FAD-binding protein YdhS [Streptomyces sp. 3330]